LNESAATGSSSTFPRLVAGLIAVASAVGEPDRVFAQSPASAARLPDVLVIADRIAESIECTGSAVAVLQGADIAVRPMPASTSHGDA
jgi:hypothetical protein